MKKFFQLVIALAAVSGFATAQAQVDYAGSPHACVPSNSTLAKFLQYAPGQVYSTATEEELFVHCWLTRKLVDPTYELAIRLLNRNTEAMDIRCLLREVAVDGTIIRSASTLTNVPAESSAEASMTLLNIPTQSGVSMTCRIPPGGGIANTYQRLAN